MKKSGRQSEKKIIIAIILGGMLILLAILSVGLYFIRRPLPEVVGESNEPAPETMYDPLSGTIDSESEIPAETETSSEEPSSEEPTSVEIVMVGDVLLHQRVMDSGKQEDGSYNFDHLFANVNSTIMSADLAIVNQETVLGGETLGISEYPSFNSPQEIGDAEVAAGFDVVLAATNHALDRGRNGVLLTTEFWADNYPDIALLGMYNSSEAADEIYIYEENGIRIAILNYTYGTNGISLPSSMPYAVNYLTESEVKADIARAQELADFVIVCPHWGTEYRLSADASQERWCNIFLDAGVDLVIGAHPHVIEPIELYTDEDGHEMLVYYSLGNYVCGTSSSGAGIANRMVGGIADVTIGYNEAGEVAILDYDIHPIVTHEGDGEEYTVYFLEDYTEELASVNWIVAQDPSFSLEYCIDLVNQVWGEYVE